MEILAENPAVDRWRLEHQRARSALDAAMDNVEEAARIGLAFMSLSAAYDAIRVDYHPGQVTVTASNHATMAQRTRSGENIHDAIALVLGTYTEPKKVCAGCGEEKSLRQFSHLKRNGKGDGRNGTCLICERKRVALYKRTRKENGGKRVVRRNKSKKPSSLQA